MDFKKTALNLKHRAQELGYDLKLTHAQELLAATQGFANRHAALVLEKKSDPITPEMEPFAIDPRTINILCQICEHRSRTKVMVTHSVPGSDVHYLCDECTGPSSRFSVKNGASDVTKHYNLKSICLRDVNSQGRGQGRIKRSFFFKLICSDGSIGDTYQFVPGLSTGFAKLSLLNVTENRLESNGWWYWSIIPLNLMSNKSE